MKSTCISAFLLAALALPAASGSFYKGSQLFSTAPNEKSSVYSITGFGPVGMAQELHQPAFAMHVGNVEPESPAAPPGHQKGQIIESMNSEALKDIDPRIQPGRIIEKAEATDGTVKFAIRGQAEPVTVTIAVLGSYSPTWPFDCPKSDKIVRHFADYLASPGTHRGFADFGMLFLLSTGDERDLPPVREWVYGLKGKRHNGYAWHIGYGGLAICEYDLRIGDPEALPVIQAWVDAAARGEYPAGWTSPLMVLKRR